MVMTLSAMLLLLVCSAGHVLAQATSQAAVKVVILVSMGAESPLRRSLAMSPFMIKYRSIKLEFSGALQLGMCSPHPSASPLCVTRDHTPVTSRPADRRHYS